MEMNAMSFMNDARMQQAAMMALFQGWEDEAYKSHLKDIFKGNESSERRFDSYEIAAVVATSWRIERADRTEFSRLFAYIKEFLVHPFTCTFKQIPTEHEGKFEYLVEDKKYLPAKEIDESKCATLAIDLICSKYDKYMKVEKLLALATELRAIYN